MEQFIECKIVGEVRTYVSDGGVDYHLPNYKKFFGVYSNPSTHKINVDCIVSANLERKPIAHVKKVERRRNFFLRLLGFKPKIKQVLALDGHYDTCRLVIAVANKSEIIFVQTEVYDALYTNNKN